MNKNAVQPAIKSYFFGKGYRDLGNTIKDSWSMNWQAAKDLGGKCADYWDDADIDKWKYLMAAGAGIAAFSVVIFGAVLFLAISLIHITILGLVFLVIYLSFTLLWGIDKLYRVRKKIFTTCSVCHKKSELPVYKCSNPRCGKEHTYLIPSSYGIVKRTCVCGQKLPTSFLNGRSKLDAQCSECKRQLEIKEDKPICIPIVGGPSVGKTCFLFSASNELIHSFAPAQGWKTSFPYQQNKDLFDRAMQDFNHGIAPAKTGERTPVAFNFFLENKKWSPRKVLYFYDAAGEAFHENKELQTHHFYGFYHGFVIIIDPFSIPELLMEYEDRIKSGGVDVRAGLEMLEDTYDAMLLNLEKNFKIKRTEMVKKPVAIVINKVDAFDLENRLGHTAVRNYMSRHPEVGDFLNAQDLMLKEQLKGWGLGNYLRKLEQKFKKYRFFTISALGRSPQNSGDKFVPLRASDPLLWLLGEADKDLKIKNGN